jgi:hypothetical protein
MALNQIDGLSTWYPRGMASLIIIDIETDEVLKHITDDRTCGSGHLSPNNGLILDENGDIYVPNLASFGYFQGFNSGFLRIKNGEDEFDPDYFFSITDLTGLDVPGGVTSYAYTDVYLDGGELYTTLFIPALTSNPPDYVNDRNYVPYVLDLWNQTATKLDMPATIGMSTYVTTYNGRVIYGMATEDAVGFYYAGDTEPFITIAGMPYMMTSID